MFERVEKICMKISNHLHNKYKSIEIQFSVNCFKIRIFVTGEEEFCCDELFRHF